MVRSTDGAAPISDPKKKEHALAARGLGARGEGEGWRGGEGSGKEPLNQMTLLNIYFTVYFCVST